ncbi:MAG: OadG family protein [Spirochaetaceae bacterium]|jgi:oxaloacetate decarboxylase gamma subunit|nr:OadG family protein [Spirochaetaceae bacterium]
MTILEMMKQSAILTALGMTIVFAFLWLLIISINLAGRLIHRLGLDKDTAPQNAAALKATALAAKNEDAPSEIAAVIAAAIVEYRKPKTDGGG